ncbi:MAG: hypothetical protein M1813_002860 [Trichoglossum hirsutum]|nr:MAG: hypothetical protein M1813_002860 [Trichoglossum hirsutum]
MHLFKTLFAIASAVAVVAAQSSLMLTTTFTSVAAGDSVKITWAGGDPTAPVTLVLRSGDPNNLNAGSVITSSATGGSFTWSVPSDIPSLSNYALEIKQGSLDNFSNQFAISGGSGTALPTGSLTATLSASNSSTSTSTSSSSSSESSSSASSSTASGNLTTTATLKTTSSSAGTTRTSAPTSSSTVAPNANTAPGFASPLALVLSAMMAMIYFN